MSKKKLRLYVGQEVEIIAGEYKGRKAWVARYQWWPDLVGVVFDESQVESSSGYRSVEPEELRPVKEMLLALSLQQPWAWLMLRPDITDPELRRAAIEDGTIKGIENRKWATKHRGPVLVHASRGFDLHGYHWVRVNLPHIPLPQPQEFERGGIVGRFTITDCVTQHSSPWFFGPYGFTVTDATPLPFMTCSGKLNFFAPVLTPAQWKGILFPELK